jgi:hypothetical protein
LAVFSENSKPAFRSITVGGDIGFGLLVFACRLASFPKFSIRLVQLHGFDNAICLGIFNRQNAYCVDTMEKHRRSYAVLGLFIVAFRFSYDTLLGVFRRYHLDDYCEWITDYE